jgi:hypothetical protein
MVRGRAEARWLPSRHRFALFRLWAYARLRGARPEPDPNVMLMVNPDQSATEVFTTSSWVSLTTSAYIAAELAESWPLAIAIASAIPLAMAAVQIPLYVCGTLILPTMPTIARTRPNALAAINSVVTWIALLLAASYYATKSSWARFAAWQFLAVVALNAVAATILFLLRKRVAALEASYGVTPSPES